MVVTGRSHGERTERDDIGRGNIPVRRRVGGGGIRGRNGLVEARRAGTGVGKRRERGGGGVRANGGHGVVRGREVGGPRRAGLEAGKRGHDDLRLRRRVERVGARLAEAGDDEPEVRGGRVLAEALEAGRDARARRRDGRDQQRAKLERRTADAVAFDLAEGDVVRVRRRRVFRRDPVVRRGFPADADFVKAAGEGGTGVGAALGAEGQGFGRRDDRVQRGFFRLAAIVVELHRRSGPCAREVLPLGARSR